MSSTFALLSPDLRQVLTELGFATLTPIQEQCIPVLLTGKDLIAKSPTGSGKTMAFAAPLLELLNPRLKTIQAVVLCPTRELCAQVARQVRRLGRRIPGLFVTEVVGGQPFRAQALALGAGTHIVVGTPGRVLDHVRRGTMRLSCVAHVVLDEADRMLDMGFADDMRAFLESCPARRQTVLFSATYPPEIESLSHAYQRQPGSISVEGAAATPEPIAQYLVSVERSQKHAATLQLLRAQRPESAIVFCNLKASAAELATYLSEAGLSAAALHGDLEQRDRDRVMAKFRNRSTRILIATDVAARGIDVDDVTLVVNYDVPSQPEVYVHRIGRTGRSGKKGLAVALASPQDRRRLEAIEAFTRVSLLKGPPPAQAASGAPSQDAAPASERGALMATLRIGGGRKEKVRPGDIVGALTGEAGHLPFAAIGKIEIYDHFSYVAVPSKLAEAARRSLADGRIKGRRFSVELEL